MEPAITDFNGKPHEVCGACGSIVGHGCPDSEPCDCDQEPPRCEEPCEACEDSARTIHHAIQEIEAEAAEAALCSVCRSAVCLSACPNADPCDCERELDEEHRAGCIFWRTPL